MGVLSSGTSSGSSMFGMPMMGMKTFSLSAEEKLSFFAGESDILRDSMAEAACWTVSYKYAFLCKEYLRWLGMVVATVPFWRE